MNTVCCGSSPMFSVCVCVVWGVDVTKARKSDCSEKVFAKPHQKKKTSKPKNGTLRDGCLEFTEPDKREKKFLSSVRKYEHFSKKKVLIKCKKVRILFPLLSTKYPSVVGVFFRDCKIECQIFEDTELNKSNG